MYCPKCGSNRAVKNGSEILLCQSCDKTFTLRKPEHPFEFKLDCVKLYIRRVGISARAEVKGIHTSLVSYQANNFQKL